MAILVVLWKFFTSKIGAYVLIGLAVAFGLWWIYHSGKEAQWEKDKPIIEGLKEDLEAVKTANRIASEAEEKAHNELSNQQGQVIVGLRARLVEAEKKPRVVYLKPEDKNVFQPVAAVVDAACTITTAFVWMRDAAFHPEYAELARKATPEESGADSGLRASEVAQRTGMALGQCKAALEDQAFNLEQWEQWYEKNKVAWDAYQVSMTKVKADLQAGVAEAFK